MYSINKRINLWLTEQFKARSLAFLVKKATQIDPLKLAIKHKVALNHLIIKWSESTFTSFYTVFIRNKPCLHIYTLFTHLRFTKSVQDIYTAYTFCTPNLHNKKM